MKIDIPVAVVFSACRFSLDELRRFVRKTDFLRPGSFQNQNIYPVITGAWEIMDDSMATHFTTYADARRKKCPVRDWPWDNTLKDQEYYNMYVTWNTKIKDSAGKDITGGLPFTFTLGNTVSNNEVEKNNFLKKNSCFGYKAFKFGHDGENTPEKRIAYFRDLRSAKDLAVTWRKKDSKKPTETGYTAVTFCGEKDEVSVRVERVSNLDTALDKFGARKDKLKTLVKGARSFKALCEPFFVLAAEPAGEKVKMEAKFVVAQTNSGKLCGADTRGYREMMFSCLSDARYGEGEQGRAHVQMLEDKLGSENRKGRPFKSAYEATLDLWKTKQALWADKAAGKPTRLRFFIDKEGGVVPVIRDFFWDKRDLQFLNRQNTGASPPCGRSVDVTQVASTEEGQEGKSCAEFLETEMIRNAAQKAFEKTDTVEGRPQVPAIGAGVPDRTLKDAAQKLSTLFWEKLKPGRTTDSSERTKLMQLKTMGQTDLASVSLPKDSEPGLNVGKCPPDDPEIVVPRIEAGFCKVHWADLAPPPDCVSAGGPSLSVPTVQVTANSRDYGEDTVCAQAAAHEKAKSLLTHKLIDPLANRLRGDPLAAAFGGDESRVTEAATTLADKVADFLIRTLREKLQTDPIRRGDATKTITLPAFPVTDADLIEKLDLHPCIQCKVQTTERCQPCLKRNARGEKVPSTIDVAVTLEQSTVSSHTECKTYVENLTPPAPDYLKEWVAKETEKKRRFLGLEAKVGEAKTFLLSKDYPALVQKGCYNGASTTVGACDPPAFADPNVDIDCLDSASPPTPPLMKQITVQFSDTGKVGGPTLFEQLETKLKEYSSLEAAKRKGLAGLKTYYDNQKLRACLESLGKGGPSKKYKIGSTTVCSWTQDDSNTFTDADLIFFFQGDQGVTEDVATTRGRLSGTTLAAKKRVPEKLTIVFNDEKMPDEMISDLRTELSPCRQSETTGH
uniref:Uncharacterized protein n=1 Tax=Chromera velia CCMP2878 TaxID=1169474 RepID=A0A0G4G329_9ALVE|eukprot:Cvel_4125.t1-p1 / transcript=Cvel_4125.t1 / gene=Cvel_4125 / organism=Chromera_velia_CCMP2878 / gene_product=hypothetical protein / transcript_product=hypothetical protein / location=Cvel_scaffold176:73156-90291(-) / protein_length=955 / sequence_SO=supercontig / SO=protein_coding / is_pseudo=false